MATVDEVKEKLEGQILSESQSREEGLTTLDRIRLMSQGAAFNFSDEMIAAIRAMGAETYEEAVAAERAALESARAKEGSLKYELGGAVAPGLLLAPFTGGASIPATTARLATIGAAQGLGSAVGAREGNIVDRITDDPGQLAVATGLSAAAGPAGKVASKVVTKGVDVVTSPVRSLIGAGERAINQRLAKPVEDELIRIASSSGLTVDEIIARVRAGEIIPDMTEQSANAVRALYAASGEGGQVIAEAVSRRADELPDAARAALQSDLVPNIATGNVTKFFDKSIASLKKAEGEAYDEIFEASVGKTSNSLNLAVQEVLQNQKFLRNKVNTLLAAKNKPPLFKVVEGKVELLDDVDLETAEIVRRALNDKASATFKGGEGSLGTAISELEGGLRNVIDEFSPELAATRANWARIAASKQAFDDGKRIFGKSADDAEVFFEDLVAKGDMQAVASFRAGVAAAIRAKGTTGAKSTMIRNFADTSKKERMILEKIYPGDSAEAAFEKLRLADAALRTERAVLGGSPTAITAENVKRIGTEGLSDLSALAGGDILAGVRLLKKVLGSSADNLSQGQLREVAELVVSENADLLQRALTDDSARVALANAALQISRRFESGVAGAAAIETGEAVDQSATIDSIAGSISGAARNKVISAANQ